MAKSIRVYELAKDIGVDSKEVIAALADMGIVVKNHMATVDDAAVAAVMKHFAPPPPSAGLRQ